MTSTPTIRVLLADDHPVLVDGLALILDTEPDITVVGRANNGTEGTIKYHINRIFDKLAVRNRTEAVLVALKRGIAYL